MILDQTTTILFRKTPRDIGRPYRQRINSFEELQKFVSLQNGLSDVFVGLYDYQKIIDKLWFDIDAPSLEEALESAKKLFQKLKEKGLEFHVIFSGAKGFHFYILIDDYRPPNTETGRLLLRQAFEQLTEGIDNIDRHVKGDINRLVRVPGSLHPKTGKYCTFLPDNFINWTAREIAEYSSRFHTSEPKPRYELNKIIDFNKVYRNTKVHEYKFEAQSHHISENIIEMLKPLIRPCVLQILQNDREPPHDIRTTFVAELHWLGYGHKDIKEICSKLNWIDYDPNVTGYHIKKIIEKNLFPTSTGKIHQLIDCNCQHDDWWYNTGGKN